MPGRWESLLGRKFRPSCSLSRIRLLGARTTSMRRLGVVRRLKMDVDIAVARREGAAGPRKMRSQGRFILRVLRGTGFFTQPRPGTDIAFQSKVFARGGKKLGRPAASGARLGRHGRSRLTWDIGASIGGPHFFADRVRQRHLGDPSATYRTCSLVPNHGTAQTLRSKRASPHLPREPGHPLGDQHQRKGE
jgi:hypothetical protein